jgi:hypothetical protein
MLDAADLKTEIVPANGAEQIYDDLYERRIAGRQQLRTDCNRGIAVGPREASPDKSRARDRQPPQITKPDLPGSAAEPIRKL